MHERLTPAELEFLAEAAQYLERPSLLTKLAALVGKPLEALVQFAPERVHHAVQGALERAMTLAIATIPAEGRSAASGVVDAHSADEDFRHWGKRTGFWHSLYVVASGAGGGALGLPGLAIELPVTTALIFRSIASIAQEFGEPLSDPTSRLECLAVFSYGGTTPDDDTLESSYLTSRIGLQEAISHAATIVAKVSADELAAMIRNGTAPRLVQLLAKLGAKFDLAVSQKFIAQSIPLLGAVTGAAINVAFLDHFNRVARYHFGIRRLERLYGADVVQNAYRQQAGVVLLEHK